MARWHTIWVSVWSVVRSVSFFFAAFVRWFARAFFASHALERNWTGKPLCWEPPSSRGDFSSFFFLFFFGSNYENAKKTAKNNKHVCYVSVHRTPKYERRLTCGNNMMELWTEPNRIVGLALRAYNKFVPTPRMKRVCGVFVRRALARCLCGVRGTSCALCQYQQSGAHDISIYTQRGRRRGKGRARERVRERDSGSARMPSRIVRILWERCDGRLAVTGIVECAEYALLRVFHSPNVNDGFKLFYSVVPGSGCYMSCEWKWRFCMVVI